MKVTVRINEFKRVLEEAQYIANQKPLYGTKSPVLENVKIEVQSDGRATIIASDLYMSIAQFFEVVDGDAGSFLLDPKKAQTFLKGHKGGTTTIEADALCTISVGAFSTKLTSVSAAHFPNLEPMPECQFRISLKFLKKLITQVEPTCPEKAGRHSVASILLESNATTLRAVASDGHRIAIADALCDCGEFSFQVPKTLLPILKRREGTMVQFAESETNFFFRTESALLTCRKPTTTFPKYQKALTLSEGAFKAAVRVSSAELKSALSNLWAGLDKKNPNVAFAIRDNVLRLTMLSGKPDEEKKETAMGLLEVETEGEPVTVRLNPNFVVDFLSRAEGEIVIRATNDAGLVTFTSGRFLNLIMPILPDEPKKEVAAQESPSAVNA